MRPFAFKNMTVNLAGGAKLCLQNQPTCQGAACSLIAVGLSRIPSYGDLVPDCRRYSLIPGGGGGGCCGTYYSTLPSESFHLNERVLTTVDPIDIDVLRTQLTEAVELLDVQEERVKARFGPQSLDEVQLVEEQLEATLAEVREIKKGFEG